MNPRLHGMYDRAFNRFFQEYIERGFSKDKAIELAERDAAEVEDRYVDEKIEEQKLRKRGIEP